MSTHPYNRRPWWSDPSLIGLLVANGFTIWLVLTEDPSLTDALWIYWGQSVVIGLLTIARIFAYGIAPEKMMQSIQQAKAPLSQTVANRIAKWLLAPFFLVHYGGFHLVYALFLLAFSADIDNATGFGGQETHVTVIVTAVSFFAFAHVLSFVLHHHAEKARKTTVDEFISRAYGRIIPMHFTILLGGFLTAFFKDASLSVMLLFLTLKAVSDVGAHIAEHRNEA